MKRYLSLGLAFLLISFTQKSWAGQATIAADLIQPFLLGGWNINGYYYFDNGLTIGWSHGDDLKINYSDSFATQPLKDAKVNVFTDWSTGPEVGYRFGKFWDARIDFKAHYSRLNFESRSDSLAYTVYTIGPSVFYNWFPFSNDTEGFLVQLSARYWFNVGDNLDRDNFSYTDKDGQTKVHKSDGFWDGALSGFGMNVAFGYAF
jgi:hypothetical protein